MGRSDGINVSSGGCGLWSKNCWSFARKSWVTIIDEPQVPDTWGDELQEKTNKELIGFYLLLVFFVFVSVAIKSRIAIDLSLQSKKLKQSGIIVKEMHKSVPDITDAVRSAEEILNEEYYPHYQLIKKVEGNCSPY